MHHATFERPNVEVQILKKYILHYVTISVFHIFLFFLTWLFVLTANIRYTQMRLRNENQTCIPHNSQLLNITVLYLTVDSKWQIYGNQLEYNNIFKYIKGLLFQEPETGFYNLVKLSQQQSVYFLSQ